MAFVRVGGKPIASVGPCVVYRRGGSRADGKRGASAVFDARGRGGTVGAGRRPYRCCGGAVGAGRRPYRGMAELLGWDGVGVGPEATAVLPRFVFGGGVGGRGVETLVVPGVASLEHFEVDVASVDVDFAEDAPVLVAALVSDADIFAEDEGGEVVFRLLPERLMGFGRVNSVEADFVLGGGG